MNKRIGIVIYPGFQVLDLAALTVFEFANAMQGDIAYEFAVLSMAGGPVRSSAGVVVESEPFSDGVHDTLVVAGALAIPGAMPELAAALGAAAPACRRVASVCTGAFLLAEAGLLDGKRATTHWAYGRALQERYAGVLVDEDKIFVKDGAVWSSAGGTACIDLALALVEADVGVEVARKIARGMVVHHRRTGGQSQFSALAEMEPGSDRVKQVLHYARDNLRRELSVEELAAQVHWSPRHFSRVFQAQTGLAPAKAVEKLRVEAAQGLIEQGHTSIARIAELVGFGDEERLRRAFQRAFGQPPKVFVHQARGRQDHVYLA